MKYIIFFVLMVIASYEAYNAYKIPKLKTVYSSEEDKIYIFDLIDGKNSKRYLTFSKDFPTASKQGTIFTKQKGKIASSYVKMALFGLSFKPNPQKVLVVGMGVGIIPSEIAKFFPKSEMDIVEIEPKIPPIAQEYFGFTKTDNMNIFIEDGYSFIINSSKKYDTIFFDVFDENYIPPQFLTDDFMLKLKHILTEDGILIFNTFTNSDTYKEEEEVIKSKFAYNKQIVLNNRVIFSSDTPLEEGKIPKDLAEKIGYKKHKLKLH